MLFFMCMLFQIYQIKPMKVMSEIYQNYQKKSKFNASFELLWAISLGPCADKCSLHLQQSSLPLGLTDTLH